MPPPSSPERPTYTAPAVKTDADRAMFFKDTVTDNLFNSVMALGAEVWAVRRRQFVLEALLRDHGGITPQMVELYTPSAAEAAQWAVERDAFVKAMMDPFLKAADIPYGSSLKPGA